jgi:signal transduction histidine kinase
VRLAVADNGRGFAGQPGSASAQGLKNLRHRIESLNGAFAVRSVPGEGTRIEARMPANPPDDATRAPRATTPP